LVKEISLYYDARSDKHHLRVFIYDPITSQATVLPAVGPKFFLIFNKTQTTL